jgi:isopenicillin-N N-acyltransferase like protein
MSADRISAAAVLDLGGSRFDIGFAHGAAHRERIRTFLDDGVARINALLYEPVTLAGMAPLLRAYRDVIARHLPEMDEEIRGLSEGAGIDRDEALLLQLRREIVGYRKIPRPGAARREVAGGECTTFGRLDDGGAVLGQTVDLNGEMERELTLLRVTHANGRRVLLMGFTGLLGYLGMNDAGLAIGLNLVLGGDWHPGIPGYMAIRHLLDCATGVDEALALLDTLPLASSRTLVMCDGRRLVAVELVDGDRRVIEERALVHTNHLLHADFIDRDELNPFARTSSMRRLAACRERLQKMPPRSTAEAYLRMLAEPPIYVAPGEDIRQDCTVAAVVMWPGQGCMTVSQGQPLGGARVALSFTGSTVPSAPAA